MLIAYARLLDARDLVGYSKLFARDGEWTGPFVGTAHGPDNILALLKANLGDAPPGSHHLMTNMAITVDGDTGGGWSRWTYLVPDADGAPRIVVSGHYDDAFVREDGFWRFKSRVVFGDISGKT